MRHLLLNLRWYSLHLRAQHQHQKSGSFIIPSVNSVCWYFILRFSSPFCRIALQHQIFHPLNMLISSRKEGKGPPNKTKQNKNKLFPLGFSFITKGKLYIYPHPKSSVDFTSLPGTGSHDHPLQFSSVPCPVV